MEEETIFPRGDISSGYPHWHGIFDLLYRTNPNLTAGRSSMNGGRFASGHFTGGHDGMANLCKPITAYDFHVTYNKTPYIISGRYFDRIVILYDLTLLSTKL